MTKIKCSHCQSLISVDDILDKSRLICSECIEKLEYEDKYKQREFEDDDDDSQLKLFEVEATWEEEWKDMPLFEQKNTEPFQSVLVHFKNKNDREDFAKLISQTITYRTKFIYYPKDEPITKDYIWSDEEE